MQVYCRGLETITDCLTEITGFPYHIMECPLCGLQAIAASRYECEKMIATHDCPRLPEVLTGNNK